MGRRGFLGRLLSLPVVGPSMLGAAWVAQGPEAAAPAVQTGYVQSWTASNVDWSTWTVTLSDGTTWTSAG
jgi:hypothetical protein